ncbi:MAG: hypothetical protein ACTSQF_05925 [Candidatus Heimdallarchaeaceae archaeon]
MASTTLITTDIGSENSTYVETQEDPEGPTFPGYTPPDTNGNGIADSDTPTIPSQVIPIVIGLAIVILIVVLVLQKRKASSSGEFYKPKERAPSVSIKRKREKFRTHISTLMEVLNEYLEEGKYAEGIIFGYHQLDNNMKRILGIKRETYLTPKEFSQSMDLPKVVKPLNRIIDLFYLTRYRISPMKYEDLKEFIVNLQTLKEMSKFDSDIQIVRTEEVGEEK